MIKIRSFIDNAYDYTDNPLAWLFFLSSFGFYVALGVVAPLTDPDPVLYLEMVNHVKYAPVVWGVIGLLSLVLFAIGVYLRSKVAIRIFSAIQVSLWVYAGIAYFTSGVFSLFVAAALPHILFWAWNYVERKPRARSLTR